MQARAPSLVGLLPVVLLPCLAACAFKGDFLTPHERLVRPYDELDYPGFVDLGVGYGVALDTRDAPDNDADGILVSLKAYPAGRWYSTARSRSARALDQGSRLATVKVLQERNFQKRMDLESELQEKGLSQEAREELEGQRKALRKESEELDRGEQRITSELDRTIQSLERARGELESDQFYYVEGRTEWYHRFSVFYGASAGNFSGGGLESTVNTVGLGFDLAPQLALQVGWAFYEVDDGAGIDTDSGLFVGVSLNLNAFKAIFSRLGDGS